MTRRSNYINRGFCKRSSHLVKMLKILLPIIFSVALASQQDDKANSKNNTKGPKGTLTTAAGAPVEYDEATSSLNTDLLTNEHLIDELVSLNRERIPERVVHAPGTGAFGYFECTHDISHFCKAKLFSKVGKRTPIAVRFSIGVSSKGSSDTVRETRGFALRFYTEDGNFDLLGLNTPAFAFKDPLLLNALSHSFRPNPASNLPDPNATWDFVSRNPETLHHLFHTFSDYGMPFNYRTMAGYPIHTYQVYNDKGESTFFRFHFVPDAGIKNFNLTESLAIGAGDRDYYARDLYTAIGNGQYPSWKLKIQILSEADVKKADYEAFDVTKTLSTDRYPLYTVGTFVLNKNPINYFAEVEQIAFCPGNLVPGILGSPDKVFESRRLAYRDAASYRLGGNFKKIPVNCPIQGKALTYNRDGFSPVNDNGRDSPNYYPNSYNGPIPYVDKNRPKLIKIIEKSPNNFKQVAEFYSKILTRTQRNDLIALLVASLSQCDEIIQKRAIKWFSVINSDLGNRVTKGLAAN